MRLSLLVWPASRRQPAKPSSFPPGLPTILTSGGWEPLERLGSGGGQMLTPLSCEDLSAQPLSPATLAFLESMQRDLEDGSGATALCPDGAEQVIIDTHPC